MTDKIFWEYLEELPEQETAWRDWHQHLDGWYCFNTFYTHYLSVEGCRAKLLNCPSSCEQGCPRQVVENSPSDIAAVCTQNKADPILLKFRDILIYSLRHEDFHKAICVAMQIEQPLSKLSECRKPWYLGEYSGTAVYLTYRMTELTETISSLCLLLRQAPFILLVPTKRGMTIEAQQMLEENDSVFLSLADELTLQMEGTFSSKRSMTECMKSQNHPCPSATKNKTLPIQTYKYLVYKNK